MGKSRPETIEALRKLMAGAPPATSSPVLPLSTGRAAVDDLLGGGLPRGRIVELAGARSSGKTALALGAMAQVTRRGRLCAWVDGRQELYPPSVAAMGVDLEKLLVVRASSLARAGEILARSAAFSLIVLDLPEPARLEDVRLRAAVHGGNATVLALASRPGVVPHATLKLEVAAHHVTLWKGGAAAPGTRVRMETPREIAIDPNYGGISALLRNAEAGSPPILRPDCDAYMGGAKPQPACVR